jgi:hypothetical protein
MSGVRYTMTTTWAMGWFRSRIAHHLRRRPGRRQL